MSEPRVPLIIINRDRLECLKFCVDGFLANKQFDIYIHDNQTTFQPTKNYYKQGEKEGKFKVVYNDKNDFVDSIQKTIDIALKNTECPYYAVTDSDVFPVSPHSFDVFYYLAFMENNQNINCCGAMLEIYNVKREDIRQWHISQFWGKKPSLAFIEDVPILYQLGYTDTTFAVYRRGDPYERLQQGAKLYWPQSCYHHDWYQDPDKLTPDYIYYKENCNQEISTYDARDKDQKFGFTGNSSPKREASS